MISCARWAGTETRRTETRPRYCRNGMAQSPTSSSLIALVQSLYMDDYNEVNIGGHMDFLSGNEVNRRTSEPGELANASSLLQ